MIRFFNCWRKSDGWQTFSLFNVWYGPKIFGVTILNIGFEWLRKGWLIE